MADEKRIERAKAFWQSADKGGNFFQERAIARFASIEVAAKLREVAATIKDNYPEDGDGLRFSIWLAGYLFTLTAEADALEGE